MTNQSDCPLYSNKACDYATPACKMIIHDQNFTCRLYEELIKLYDDDVIAMLKTDGSDRIIDIAFKVLCGVVEEKIVYFEDSGKILATAEFIENITLGHEELNDCLTIITYYVNRLDKLPFDKTQALEATGWLIKMHRR